MSAVRTLCFGMLLWGVAAHAIAQEESPGFPNLQKVGDFPDWTTSVAFSPDGTLLAIGSYDIVRIWNVAEKSQIDDFKTRCGFAHALAFDPSGETLLVGGYQQVQVWNVAETRKQATWSGHRGYIRDLVFSPDHTQVATASEDGTVRIWNAVDGTEVRVIGPLEYPVLGVAWSPDGALLATAEGDETRLTKPGPIKLWNATDGTLRRELLSHERGATDVVFTSDGQWLLSSSLDEHVQILDASTGLARPTFEGFSRPVNALLVADATGLVIAASGGRFKGKNEVKVLRATDGSELASVEVHEQKVTAIAFAPSTRMLATASYDQTVAIWDLSAIVGASLDAPAVTSTTIDSPIAVEVAPDDTATDDLPSDSAPEPATDEAQSDDEAADAPESCDDAASVTRDPHSPMRIGIIGLDTSHAMAFTQVFNAPEPVEAVRGFRVVAAYPQGSADIQSSVSRIPQYTEEIKGQGIEIVDSIPALLERVDCVLLETNDGRPHLEQVLPVLQAGKPVFVDKPVAGSLVDAIAIYEAARFYDVPLFSASSLRWIGGAQQCRNNERGGVLGCDTFSPCDYEQTHPDLYWYGIHGVEALFTVMGTGCETVTRTQTLNFDLATGVWGGGRIGTFRGMRAGARGYGGTAYTSLETFSLCPYPGYQPLVESIAHFFRTGEAPVTPEETLEIYAFMSAADESRNRGGVPVTLEEVLTPARAAATARLKELIPEYVEP
jgi:WD40 repeat protein